MASAPGHALWPLLFTVMAERAGGDVQPPRKPGTWLPPDSPLWMTGEAWGGGNTAARRCSARRCVLMPCGGAAAGGTLP